MTERIGSDRKGYWKIKIQIRHLLICCQRRGWVAVFIHTGEKHSKLTGSGIDSFNREYPSLTVKYTTEFLDRFLIIDSKALYHSGTSLKDAGKKAFEISGIDDEKQTEEILGRL